MNKPRKRMRVADLNSNLICVLCGGYFIDATTLTECLHSFCKTCIVKYLETSKHCPVCEVMVHKTRPHLHIRSDKMLQDMVYKLVPDLYKNEMKRRRDFFAKHPHAAPPKAGEARGDENTERILYSKDDSFSLSLHFCSQGVKDERSVRTLTLPEIGAAAKEPHGHKNVRFLQCPAGVTVDTLKRFVHLKYDLPQQFQIDIFHTDESLRDEFTLMDVAYIYTWRRKEPLKLNFSVYEFIVKRRKLDCPSSGRLLDLKNLIKHVNKSPTAKANAKPASKPTQPDLKSSNSGKLGKQGDKGQSWEVMEMDIVKEEPEASDSAEPKPLEPMDITTTSASQPDQQAAIPRPGDAKSDVKLDQVKDEEGSSEEKAPEKLEKDCVDKTPVKQVSVDNAKTPTKQENKEVESAVAVRLDSPETSLPATNGSECENETPMKPSTPTPKVLVFENSPGSSSVKAKTGGSPGRAGSVSRTNASSPKTVPLASGKISAGSPKTIALASGKMSAGTPKTVPLASGKMSLGSPKTVPPASGKVSFSSPKTVPLACSRVGFGNPQKVAISSQKISTTQNSGYTKISSTSTASPMLSFKTQTVGSTKEKMTLAGQGGVSATVLGNLGKKTVVLQQPLAAKALACSATSASATATTSASAASGSGSAASMPRPAGVTPVSHTVAKMTVSSSKGTPKPILPAQVPKSLPVSASRSNPVPSAAAAAAGAASPSSAALAASSSPSPPMASSAASIKDMMEQPVKHAPEPLKHATALTSTAKAVTSEQSCKSLASTPQTQTVPTVSSAVVGCTAESGKSVFQPSSTQSSCTLPADKSAVSVTAAPVSDDRKLFSSLAVAPDSQVKDARIPGGSLVSHKSSAGSNSEGGAAKPKKSHLAVYSCSTTNGNSPRVSVGNRSAIPIHMAGPPSGRNGMPPVVTKPARVNNAATSVNTLLHKLPVTSAQHSAVKASDAASPVSARPGGAGSPGCKQLSKPAALQDAKPKESPNLPAKAPAPPGPKQPGRPPNSTVSSLSRQASRRAGAVTSASVQPSRSAPGPSGSMAGQPARSSGASTPIPIQPQPVVSASQSIAGLAGCSPIAVAMARRASEMQMQHVLAKQHQQHQQQLLELQQLQILQQQQQHLFNMHAAAALAARYNHLQSSGLPSPGHLVGPVGVSSASAPAQPPAPSHATDSVKKQPAETAKKTTQASTTGRKAGESSPKKKITDIANSLHKKMSQTLGTSTAAKLDGSAASSSADKRPPHAHTTAGTKAENGAVSASSAGSKTPPASSASKGEEEPLNLVMTRSDSGSGGANAVTVSTAAKPDGEQAS